VDADLLFIPDENLLSVISADVSMLGLLQSSKIGEGRQRGEWLHV